uniref:CCDC66 domain-containing protein n=1 Tax=Echinostoma caproni TaxID=27848 RepID=A0A183BEX3_9TREM
LFSPGVGDTAEVIFTHLPKREYLDDSNFRSDRSQTSFRPASQIIPQRRPIHAKDRRDVSRAEADRLHAARLACLLATEAAVENARQRVLEQREAKLSELRSRMQTRHQQAEARRKALEQAEKERIAQIAKRHHRATIAHPPGQYHVQSARLGFQTRSLRVPLRPHTALNIRATQSERRSVVAFGSTTPRTVCFTSRELQAMHQMNSNSVHVDQRSTLDYLSDTNSCSLSTFDSYRSRKRQNPIPGQSTGQFMLKDNPKMIRSSYSRSPQSAHYLSNVTEFNGNAIRTGPVMSRMNRISGEYGKTFLSTESFF